MSRFIVMMVAVMATAANALAQNTTGQVEEKQDSATLSVNDTIALKDVEVVTMRQLVKTQDDRVSYNVQADPEASRMQSAVDTPTQTIGRSVKTASTPSRSLSRVDRGKVRKSLLINLTSVPCV